MGFDRQEDKNACFYSKLIIYLLEKLSYHVPPYCEDKNSLFYHILGLIISAVVLIASWVSFRQIAFLTFIIHFLNLLYTWLIAKIRLVSYCNKWDPMKHRKDTNAVANLSIPHTPYHGRHAVLSAVILLIAFMLAIIKISLVTIDPDTIFAITTYISIAFTFLQKYFDMLVLLFDADVKS